MSSVFKESIFKKKVIPFFLITFCLASCLKASRSPFDTNSSSGMVTNILVDGFAARASLSSTTASSSSFSIGGTITGLTTSGLILQNKAGDDLNVASGSSSFTFPTKVSSTYSVTVKTQPASLNCTVTNASGTATDGMNWTQRTMSATATWQSVTYGNGTFVAISQGSTNAAVSQ